MSNLQRQLESLFQQVVALPADQRSQFLDKNCPDPELRAEVEKLLAYDNIEGGGLTDQLDDRYMPTKGMLQQSAPGRGDVSLPASDLPSPSSSSIDHGRFLPGTVLSDRYRIVGMLGKGGMGEVYRADDLELGQSVALKFLPKKVADDPRALERFRGEVRLARQVSHPNVCRVYDIGQIDGQWFLSMEYVDGEDLAQLLRRIGRFPQDRATELARQLCLGLHAAHEKGVLHRDLKPSNIMIDGRGKLLITDFGLAEIADDVREDDIRSGTPAYMSPEQLAGREVTERSDIYSLGIILHEIYTGKPVWQADSMAELFEKRKSSTTPTPASTEDILDPVIQRMIKRCLDPDSSKRPSSAVSVIAGLPGGDPLQAALAAGETPSPEMVADSGEEGKLSIATGTGLFVLICLLILLRPFLSDWVQCFDFGNLKNHKPDVLENIARTFVEKFGYQEDILETARGFQAVDGRKYEFWFRSSTHPMMPAPPPLWSPGINWQIDLRNPAPTLPGMVSLRLDSSGQLLEFLAIPDRDIPENDQDIDWPELFRNAGLDIADYVRTDEELKLNTTIPPVYIDEFATWSRVDQTDTDPLIMAVYRGQLTYFRKTQEESGQSIDDAYRAGSYIEGFSGMVVIVLFSLSLLFAARNIRHAQVDYRVSIRLAALYLALDVLIWVIRGQNLTAAFGRGEITANYLLRGVAGATRAWVYFVALEPIVRKYWPDMLVTWTRITSGRIRDPLFGRDILSACLGVCSLSFINYITGDWTSTHIHFPTWANVIMPRYAVAAFLGSFQHAFMGALGVLTWFLVFRVFLRSTWAAGIAFTIVLSLALGPGNPNTWLGATILALLFMKFGLVTVFVWQTMVFFIHQIPFTAELDCWYSTSGVFAITVVILVALYGYYCSTLRFYLNGELIERGKHAR